MANTKVQQWVDSYNSWSAQPKQEIDNQAGGMARMTSDLHPYTEMFSPIQINRTTIKNRLVMAPMGNITMCEETGRPNDQMLQYFFARAKGGTGLLTTGLIPISYGIDTTITELGDLSYFPRIDRSRTVFSAWRDLAQGVHALGSKIFVQLTPGLGRVGNPECLLTQYKLPVSASFNPNYYMPQVPSRRLSDRKLKKLVKNAGQASADALAMGLDGVYLHGHEGYLLEQMTNPAFNRRKIGRYSDWMRFGLDMVREMRRRVGPHYPIMYRIDLSLALEETYNQGQMEQKPLKKFKGGRTATMTIDYMEELVKAGVDIFDVDLGCYDNWWLPHPPSSMPAGCFLPVAQLVKEHFEENNVVSNAGVPVPIVGVGKLGYPDVAEQALRDGACDMIMLGRPLLCDAEWANKAYAGNVEAIRPCIGCQEGCINEFVNAGHPQCAVNPRTGFEHLMPAVPAPVKAAKKVAVVGGGPSGIVLAVTAAQRGHSVTLYEKADALGGNIVPGCKPIIKFDIQNYLKYLNHIVKKAEKEDGLTVKLSAAVTAEQLKKEGYDTAVFAVGTSPIKLNLPGMEGANTIDATDLLLQEQPAQGAKRVVVVGGGLVGCEVAHWLRYQHGKEVTVVEMLSHFMDGVCTANRGHIIHALHQGDVELLNYTKVTGFGDGTVKIARNTDKNVPNPYDSWSPILPKNIENPLEPTIEERFVGDELEADLAVLAIGGKADNALYFEAQRIQAAPQMYNIGDSFSPGMVLQAVRAGYRLGTEI